MHKIYRRNRRVYAHNPDPVVKKTAVEFSEDIKQTPSVGFVRDFMGGTTYVSGETKEGEKIFQGGMHETVEIGKTPSTSERDVKAASTKKERQDAVLNEMQRIINKGGDKLLTKMVREKKVSFELSSFWRMITKKAK